MAEAFIMRRGGDSSSGGKFAMGTLTCSSLTYYFKLDISKLGFVPKQVEIYRTVGSYEPYDVYGLYWTESGGGYVNGTASEVTGVTKTMLVNDTIFRLDVSSTSSYDFYFGSGTEYRWIAFENECDILTDAATANSKTGSM